MCPGDPWFEGRIPEAVRADPERRGHKVEMRGLWSINNSAGAEPRTTAAALAW